MSTIGAPDLKSEIAAFVDVLKLQDTRPFCTGSVHLSKDVSTLFYRNKAEGSGGALEFNKATEDDLLKLAKACEPATFGVGREDVLDESYRKAWKMDSKDFMAKFRLADTNIMDYVADGLVPTTHVDRRKKIHAELYKLNVYGPGSFFKPHVDTPRSKEMLGSLVLIFPTVHEGGSLVFRKGGKEWSFDSAQEVSVEDQTLVWVAFYSDLEHEVMPITSGYRVTITYNIYYSKETDKSSAPVETSVIAAPATVSQQIHENFSALLLNPAFISPGGLIGLGLHHLYAFDPLHGSIEGLDESLKGRDMLLLHTLRDLGLKTSLKIVYQDEDDEQKFYLSDYIHAFQALDAGELGSFLMGLDDVVDVRKVLHPGPEYAWEVEKGEPRLLICLTKVNNERNSFSEAIDKYGNDGGVCIYGHVALVAEVGPFGNRKTLKKIVYSDSDTDDQEKDRLSDEMSVDDE